MTKIPEVDLGLIKVHQIGLRDAIFLGHNDELVAIVSCSPGKGAVVQIRQSFFAATDFQWRQVFELYLTWKRQTCPEFKPPGFALTREGKSHPWRSQHRDPQEAAREVRRRKFFGQSGD